MAACPCGYREVEELRGEDERRGYSEDRDLLLVESVADFVESVCDGAGGHAVGSPPGLEVEQPVRDMHASTSFRMVATKRPPPTGFQPERRPSWPSVNGTTYLGRAYLTPSHR